MDIVGHVATDNHTDGRGRRLTEQMDEARLNKTSGDQPPQGYLLDNQLKDAFFTPR